MPVSKQIRIAVPSPERFAHGPSQLTPFCARVHKERAALAQLDNADVEETIAGDPVALANLFADDGVLLAPGSKPAVGREAILAEIRKDKALSPEAKALSYNPHVQDTQIMDGWAVE